MRDNSQRAKNAITLMWIILILEIAMALSSYLQLNLLEKIADGTYYDNGSINTNDIREGIVALAYIAGYIVSVVMFVRWFRRAYYNLHTQMRGLSFEEGWAAGCWFVPILNLFRPYQIMKELYVETQKLIANRLNVSRSVNLTIVGIWWALWVISNIINNFVTRITWLAKSIDDFILSSQLSIVTSLIGIPLCLITVKVIRDYAEMESTLYRLVKEEETTSFEDLDPTEDDNVLDAFR